MPIDKPKIHRLLLETMFAILNGEILSPHQLDIKCVLDRYKNAPYSLDIIEVEIADALEQYSTTTIELL